MSSRALRLSVVLVAFAYACGGTILDPPNGAANPDGGAAIGAACSAPSDCATGTCTSGACAPANGGGLPDASPPPIPATTCTDGVKNGAETDVDCGGTCPKTCEVGKACKVARDCATTICTLGTCAGPSASDGIRNADETDVDCGGPNAPPCAGGKTCVAHRDCLAGACANGRCLATPATQATTLASGTNYACAILGNGELKCWGENQYGQLGLGDSRSRGLEPGDMGDALPAVDLGTGRTAKAIAAGQNHTCVILDNGGIKCWGTVMGLGTHANVGYAAGDEAGEMGNALPYVDVGTGRTARAITAGWGHTCAILDDATLKCWGNNAWGAVGNGTFQSPSGSMMGDNLPTVNLGVGRTVKAVAAGGYHTCAVLDIGSVKCWGRNAEGQLGLGDTTNRGNYPSDMGNELPAVQLGIGRTAKAISVGVFSTCVLLDDGSVKCWGTAGALGTGDTFRRGDTPGGMGDALLPINLGTGRTARAIAMGYSNVCVVLDDNSVKCFGNGYSGALGNESNASLGDEPNEMGDYLPRAKLGTGRFARTVSVGERFGCAALENNGVKCWGWNTHGQLGLGMSGDRGNAPGQMGDNLPFVNLGTGRTLRLP